MVLNLDKTIQDELADRFIEYNICHFQTINKTYGLKIVDQYAIHAIDQYKKFSDSVMRPRLGPAQRQIVNEISYRIASHWDLFKMIFDDDKEYQDAIGKAPEWCRAFKQMTEFNGPKNYHDLTKVFLACESFMLAMDDYYSVEHFQIP